MILDRKTAIVYSAHIGTRKENIGDVLSAKAIAILCGLKKIKLYHLPAEIGFSADVPVIYGGGGMIRPLFSEKENKDFILRDKKQPHSIYGVGINFDINGESFSKNDFAALKQWILNAKSVTVRDLDSLKFIHDKLGFNAKLAPCPTYTVLKNKKLFFKTIRIKNKIGIVPSFGHTDVYTTYRENVINLINDLINKIGSSNLCIICHDEQDYDFSLKFFGKKGVSITKPLTFDDVYIIYKSCGSIITLRGHGIIFAAATGKACSYIPLNIKLNSLYHYHYGADSRGINFDAEYHLKKLEKNKLPIDLNINFNL